MVGERRILATARLWRRPGTEPCQSVHTVCGCSLTVTAVLGITTETMRTTKESLSGLSSLPSSTLDNTVLKLRGHVLQSVSFAAPHPNYLRKQ